MLAPLRIRDQVFDWSRPYWVGVVNVTPDSFSDGGRYLDPSDALRHAKFLAEEGADWLDVGGESTRPSGVQGVDAQEELARVLPVIEAIRAELPQPISIDTTKSEVARRALVAGADVVNDISGGLFDPEIIKVCADAGAAYVCGHVRGRGIIEVHGAPTPNFDEVTKELADRLRSLPLPLRQRTVADPGIGFGKDAALNLEICSRIGDVRDALLCPVMVGLSRKRFLGDLSGRPAEQRDDETVGASIATIERGAHLIRTHSVAKLRHAYQAYRAVSSATPRGAL